MRTDREIERVIKAGERNREVTELIHNWCSHARVVKCGGTGLIEMQTGLPIGHHAMACDHASASGMATWDLADAALDFHDRNCINCKLRSPLRLPNLTKLLRERDDVRERAESRRRQVAEESARALAKRQARRDELRAQVPPGSATVLEQLEELDRDPTDGRSEQLVQTARLAPEIFTREILEHLFSLVESGEGWCAEAGLRVLAALKSDPARLTRAALAALARGFTGARAAGDVLVAHAAHADPTLIPAALRIVVLLAHPPRSPFSTIQRPASNPEPLLAMYRTHPDAVRSGIHQLLNDRQPRMLIAGAHAISVIHGVDQAISAPFARSIAAVLSRGETIVDFDERAGRSEADELYSDLARALTLALTTAPISTDEVMAGFMQTCRPEGLARILRAYHHLFRAGLREEPIRENEAHSVALKRLIECASSTQPIEVLMEVLAVFRSDVPQGLHGLVRREMAHLLGAAVLMDARSSKLYEEARAASDRLDSMEKQNQASLSRQLQEGLVTWCASAAADNAGTTNVYVDVLRGIPETNESIRAIMTSALAHVMTTAEGLNAALPPLYTALVGTSQRLRAAALEVFSRLGRVHQEDLPDLLWEALVMSLQDPYLIVHQTAVRSLERCAVPAAFRRRTESLLRNLIYAYSHDDTEHPGEFLMTCISLYVQRYATTCELEGDLGALLVEKMGQMEPSVVIREISWLRDKLDRSPGFAAMAINLLASASSEATEEPAVRAVRGLSPSAIYAERQSLERVALRDPGDGDLSAIAVELLSTAGAWHEAERVAKAALEAIADTRSNRPRRLFGNLLRVATAYERVVASGSLEALASIEAEWQITQEAIERDRKENEKRRSPFLGFPGADQDK